MALPDEQALEIRLLHDHRSQLVAERTRHQNRLRWHLVDLDPELEAQVPDRALDREAWCARIACRLGRLPQTAPPSPSGSALTGTRAYLEKKMAERKTRAGGRCGRG